MNLKKKYITKKYIAVIVAFALVLLLVPTAAFADKGRRTTSQVDANAGANYNVTSAKNAANVNAETQEIKQVTNISYVDCEGQEQKVNFVPAFADNNKNYLRDNGVKYFKDAAGTNPDTAINNLIVQGCTMHELYGKLKSGNTVKTLFAKADRGVVFYGVMDEEWEEVFDRSTKANTTAKDYTRPKEDPEVEPEEERPFYCDFLNDDKGIGTIYFTGTKNSPTVDSETNWTTGQGSCPTLNGVNYSNGGKGTSTFWEAYGGQCHYGGLHSRGSGNAWTSRVTSDSNVPVCWGVEWNKWDYQTFDRRSDFGVIVTLTFGKPDVKQVTNISYERFSGEYQKVNFVPAFADNNKNYLRDNGVKYFKDAAGRNPDTEINNLITQGCTMHELYGKLKSSDSVKTLYAIANKGVVFYAIVDEQWNAVFDESISSGTAQSYNKNYNFYKFLDDNKGIGTVYFTGKKDSPSPASGTSWTTGNGDCPTLNGVNYSNEGKGTCTFFEAYGGDEGGVLSRNSTSVWASAVDNGLCAPDWFVAKYAGSDHWHNGERREATESIVFTQTFK